MFQKINNWTNGRLDGFTIEVGTGIGTAFKPASDVAGPGVENLSLSVPEDFFDANSSPPSLLVCSDRETRPP